ncbi:MAG: methyltransferase domain-containing protein [Candidatus Aenigmarchaeota archaeon]|nr:methyltransferase domain-containing protein [Candidatus Aenigmarchaeota archaeon]
MEKRIKLSVKKGYDVWAKTYDVYENPLVALEEKPLLKIIGNVRGKRVLDAGCGTGRITVKLLEKGAKVFGIDISEKMLERARVKAKKFKKRCELKLASVYKIPYPKNSFDMVVCNLVTSHLQNLKKAIAEMARVLKPKGFLIISDLHPWVILNNKGTIFFQDDKEYVIKNYYHSFEEYFRSLKESNLKIVEIKELKDNKEVIKIILRLYKKYKGKIIPKEEYKKWLGKPGALIIKAQKS